MTAQDPKPLARHLSNRMKREKAEGAPRLDGQVPKAMAVA
jgi:hypothetical protein